MMVSSMISFLFMVVFHFSTASTTTFSFTQQATGPSSVCEGNNVTCHCVIVLNPGNTVQPSVWTRNEMPVRFPNGSFIPNHHTVFNSTTGAFTDLVINDVRMEDNNVTYSCSAIGTDIASSVVLNVSGPPSFQTFSSEACLNDIMLSWGMRDQMVCGQVYYTLKRSGDTKMIILNETSYTFTGLTPGTAYTISIEMLNNDGTGQAYNETIITAPNTAMIAEVNDKCLTYIVIQIMPINESFCGENVEYNTMVSFYHNMTEVIPQIKMINQNARNITGLARNTKYSITVVALRGGKMIHQDTMNESTLESLRPPSVVNFTMSSSNITKQNDTIFLNWMPPTLYNCIPDIANFTITIIINGGTSMSRTVPKHVTSIDMSEYFSPHPMLNNNYEANIIAVNSEGESSPAGAVPDGKSDNDKSDSGSDDGDSTVTIVIVVVAVAVFISGTGGTTMGIAIYAKRQKDKAQVSTGGKPENAENQYTQANGDTSQQKADNNDNSEYAYAINGPRKIVFPSTASEMPQKQ